MLEYQGRESGHVLIVDGITFLAQLRKHGLHQKTEKIVRQAIGKAHFLENGRF